MKVIGYIYELNIFALIAAPIAKVIKKKTSIFFLNKVKATNNKIPNINVNEKFTILL